ncbi:MAG: prolipoprotein diacylglyceryl transferase [Actinobacteria bacterium]|nr:prolipoprotein diacylglyceryl transferase [Actinomycetota bacterium]
MTAAGALASIPSPSSGTIDIGGLSIHAYGLMIALGVVAAVWLLGRRFEAAGVGTRDDASAISVWGVVAGIIGARLYHVATDWSSFEHDLAKIPQIWKGGLGIPGGLLGGITVGLWAGTRRGIPAAVTANLAAPALPLAQAIGRWGNWFNQELFGKVTDLPWALRVSDANALAAGYPAGTTFHPTFLYESLWNFALCGALLAIDRKWRIRPPRLMAMYVLGYGVGRFWVEGLRIDPADHVAGLRWNQWVALVAALLAAAYLVGSRGRLTLAPGEQLVARRGAAQDGPDGLDEPGRPDEPDELDELDDDHEYDGDVGAEYVPANDDAGDLDDLDDLDGRNGRDGAHGPEPTS